MPWNATAVEGEDDDYFYEPYEYNSNDDEDEFGLPSIASSRRLAAASRTVGVEKSTRSLGDLGDNNYAPLEPSLSVGRERANSSDIAEERGPPSYPTAKRSEGKILRPQYKEILRGLFNLMRLIA
jgi:TBC1 domain family member 2